MEKEEIICPNCKKVYNRKELLGTIIIPRDGIKLEVECLQCGESFVCEFVRGLKLTIKEREKILLLISKDLKEKLI